LILTGHLAAVKHYTRSPGAPRSPRAQAHIQTAQEFRISAFFQESCQEFLTNLNYVYVFWSDRGQRFYIGMSEAPRAGRVGRRGRIPRECREHRSQAAAIHKDGAHFSHELTRMNANFLSGFAAPKIWQEKRIFWLGNIEDAGSDEAEVPDGSATNPELVP